MYQENWYDALGRRVLVRARKPASCSSTTLGELACRSFIERTVWDGDQVIIERRADGASGLTSSQLDQQPSSGEAYGEVISLHALGIDAPIAVRKSGRTTVAPHANWMGDYEIGTTANGTATSSCTGATDCPVLLWPGGQETADGFLTEHAVINTWWGGLMNEKTDPSGYRYMRNRYYNPQTGQFTQIDPIGLAGGVNLYGFAAGDPVNFSDPFGLTPVCIVAPTACAAAVVAAGKGIAAASRTPTAQRTLQAASARAHQLGRAGEAFVQEATGLVKNSAERLGSRIPDFVDRGANVFHEAKNTQHVGLSAQIREMIGNLRDGQKLIIHVREAGTTISRHLDPYIERGLVEVVRHIPK